MWRFRIRRESGFIFGRSPKNTHLIHMRRIPVQIRFFRRITKTVILLTAVAFITIPRLLQRRSRIAVTASATTGGVAPTSLLRIGIHRPEHVPALSQDIQVVVVLAKSLATDARPVTVPRTDLGVRRKLHGIQAHHVDKIEPRHTRMVVVVMVMMVRMHVRAGVGMFAVQQQFAGVNLRNGFRPIVAAMSKTGEGTMVHRIDVLSVRYPRHGIVVPI